MSLLRMEFVRAGHAAAPTHKIDTAYRPSSVMACVMPPSPKGRRISEESVHSYEIQPYTPSGTFGATSPYTPGGSAPPEALFTLLSSLFS